MPNEQGSDALQLDEDVDKAHKRARDQLLDRAPPPGYGEEWLGAVSEPGEDLQRDSLHVLVFRIAAEWLAVPVGCVQEVTEANGVHRIPYRSDEFFMGVANVRGELCLVFSLQNILGLEMEPHAEASRQQYHSKLSLSRRVFPRMVAIGSRERKFVFPTDEVYGVTRLERSQLQEVPVTVEKGLATFSRGLFVFHQQNVALLDEELLVHSFSKKHLS